MRPYILRLLFACTAMVVALLTWANWPGHPITSGAHADRLIVFKSKRQLQLYANGKLLKSYPVSLGRHPVGPKQREGDNRTPEGVYFIQAHKPDSSFHRALRVSYPSDADRKAAEKRGDPPGGDIMVHGIRNHLGFIGRLQRCFDWTSGCIAVTNPEIDEIYDAVPDGTPIEIRP